MTRATIEPTSSASGAVGAARRTLLAGVAALSLLLAACGGGDDDDDADSSTTTTVVAAAATSTTDSPTTTAAAATSTTLPAVEYVTEGATVVVANASGINGAAGRLSERLAAVGYDMAEATNSADTVGNLATTQIFYDPAVEAAQAVADSLRLAFGGGDIEVLEVSVPALTESGELGEANVLVLMGDDVADKSLEELQGVAPAEDETDDSSPDDSSPDDSSPDDSAPGESTPDDSSPDE